MPQDHPGGQIHDHSGSISCPTASSGEYPFVSISLCTFYSCLFVVDSQPLSTIIEIIDNKLYMHYDFVVFFLDSIIGLLVRYSLARTSVLCVVFIIGGVTARVIRR